MRTNQSYWNIKNNKIFVSFNVKDDFWDLFEMTISSKFRSLYADDKIYLIPNTWNLTKNKLEIVYDHELITDHENDNTISKKEFKETIQSYIKIVNSGVLGINQFIPKNGRWIPPVSYFIHLFEISEDDIHEIKSKDKLHLQTWMGDFIKSNHELQIGNYVYEKFLDLFSKNDLSMLNHELENELPTKSTHFLEILTFTEFFDLYRSIFKFQVKKLTKGNTNNSDTAILEIKTDFQDPIFMKLKRHNLIRLWEDVSQNQKTATELAITPIFNFPKPFDISEQKSYLRVDWTETNIDHHSIKVRGNLKGLYNKGYCFPFSIGTLDLLKKKQRFIKYITQNQIFGNTVKELLTATNNENIDTHPQKVQFNNINDFTEHIISSSGLFIVQGPPGTGKTYFASKLITSLLKNSKSSRVLVCAKEHQALENILMSVKKFFTIEKIEKDLLLLISNFETKKMRYSEQIDAHTIDALYGKLQSSRWKEGQKIWEELSDQTISEYDMRIKSIAETQASVLFTTTTDRNFYRLFDSIAFDLVIVEEAGKCYHSELLHTIGIGQRTVFIGDQNQLPPYKLQETQQSIRIIENKIDQINRNKELKDQSINQLGMNFQDIFDFYKGGKKLSKEELSWLEPFQYMYDHSPKSRRYFLNQQHRLPEKLSKIISNVFYSSKFENKVPSIKNLEIPSEYNFDLLWLDTPSVLENPKVEESKSYTNSYSNSYEIKLLSNYLNEFSNNNVIDLTVITPYKEQKRIILENRNIQNLLKKITGKSAIDVVHTVDEYQGQEADLVVISLVRNNNLSGRHAWGFITSPERLNVMFSRSRSHTTIIGCTTHIKRNQEEESIKYLQRFYEEFQKEGTIIDGIELTREEN